MKFIVSILGWLIFLGLGANFLCGYGDRWEFGLYGVPVSRVAPDGIHYLDGSEIDPIALALIRSGNEQQFGLVLGVLLVLAILWLCVELRKLYRVRAEYRKTFGHDFEPP